MYKVYSDTILKTVGTSIKIWLIQFICKCPAKDGGGWGQGGDCSPLLYAAWNVSAKHQVSVSQKLSQHSYSNY